MRIVYKDGEHFHMISQLSFYHQWRRGKKKLISVRKLGLAFLKTKIANDVILVYTECQPPSPNMPIAILPSVTKKESWKKYLLFLFKFLLILNITSFSCKRRQALSPNKPIIILLWLTEESFFLNVTNGDRRTYTFF